ncbi:MAG: cytochrome c oxidase subunit II [Acidimicrobiales bacterium]
MTASRLRPGRRAPGRGRVALVVVGTAVLTVALTSCGGHAPSMLAGKGTESRRVTGVWWLMFGLASAVYVVVGAFIVVAIARGRRGGRDTEAGTPKDDTFIWFGGIIVPVVILALLAVVTVKTTSVLRNPTAGELTVSVVGKRWWWDVTYPGTGVRTANEIHVPVGRTVDVKLTSDNVIHSFWVPQLAGKVDTIPGQVNDLRFKATSVGTYRGECAEYCGIEHAHMSFLVIADPPADFDRWLTRRRGGAGTTAESDQAAVGQLVFTREACAGCHTVKGTAAMGTIGPDLSDFGSRHWIGSLTVPNTPENLSHWITDAPSIKPGSLMPPIALSASDVAAVVAYLEGLK